MFKITTQVYATVTIYVFGEIQQNNTQMTYDAL